MSRNGKAGLGGTGSKVQRRSPVRKFFEPVRERICQCFCGHHFFDRDASLEIDRLTVELEAARVRIAELEASQ